MENIAKLAVLLVAVLHVLFLILEMLLWEKPAGRRVFGMSSEQARQTAVLAGNQGLYNGFLAAGLLWSLTDPAQHGDMSIFLLCCVTVAGVYGGLTAKRSILWIQALPGAVALGLVLYGGW